MRRYMRLLALTPLFPLYLLIAVYLNLNYGLGIGFGVITLALARLVLRKEADRERLLVAVNLLAPSGMLSAWLVAMCLLLRSLEPDSLPWWAAPPHESLRALSEDWVIPLTTLVGLALLGYALGLLLSLLLLEPIARRELPYPLERMFASVVRAFASGENARAKLVLKGLAVGSLPSSCSSV